MTKPINWLIQVVSSDPEHRATKHTTNDDRVPEIFAEYAREHPNFDAICLWVMAPNGAVLVDRVGYFTFDDKGNPTGRLLQDIESPALSSRDRGANAS